MRKLLEGLLIIAMLATITILWGSLANAYDVPEDAVIKVYAKDGKLIGHMSRKEYKVVKIEKDKKLQQERQVFRQYREKHSSVIVHAGPGKNGLKKGHDGSNHTIKEKDAIVFGATYCYTKNGSGVCATGMTNKTFTIGVKKDF